MANDFPIDCYKALADEIVAAAAKDLVRAYTDTMRAFTPEERRRLNNHRKMCEWWFFREHFAKLNYSGIDPDWIIKQCRKKAGWPEEWE